MPRLRSQGRRPLCGERALLATATCALPLTVWPAHRRGGGRNAHHWLKTLRHPSILKYEWEQGRLEGSGNGLNSGVLSIVTEPAEPLAGLLGSFTCSEVLLATYDILSALSFLDQVRPLSPPASPLFRGWPRPYTACCPHAGGLATSATSSMGAWASLHSTSAPRTAVSAWAGLSIVGNRTRFRHRHGGASSPRRAGTALFHDPPPPLQQGYADLVALAGLLSGITAFRRCPFRWGAL